MKKRNDYRVVCTVIDNDTVRYGGSAFKRVAKDNIVIKASELEELLDMAEAYRKLVKKIAKEVAE